MATFRTKEVKLCFGWIRANRAAPFAATQQRNGAGVRGSSTISTLWPGPGEIETQSAGHSSEGSSYFLIL